MNKKTRTFLWDLGNGLVAIMIAYITNLDIISIPIIIGLLNLFTKLVNKTFNPNYGKE